LHGNNLKMAEAIYCKSLACDTGMCFVCVCVCARLYLSIANCDISSKDKNVKKLNLDLIFLVG